jgi:hypothetical protein
MYTLLELESKTFGELKKIGDELNVLPKGDRRRRQSWIDAIAGVNPPLLQLLEVSPAVEVEPAQEPVKETVESSPAAESEQVQEPPLESKFGSIVYPKLASKPIAQNEEARPQLDGPESADIHNLGFHPPKSDRDSSGAKTEALGSQEGDRILGMAGNHQTGRGRVLPDQSTKLVNQAAKISLYPESDQNPILTGVSLSDRFIARYSPPQTEIVHFQFDEDGQLSLLDFEVQPVTDDEPPDPDDFESLDAFREAIARWDWEHPTNSFDYCSDHLPSSVQNEPSSVQNELPLQVSLDSFCLWAHCPDDWYEPTVLLEPSPVCKSSITSDFFIPTFGSFGDRSNRSDEPPDTGIFARLPKPKPPTFPPQASQPKLAASRPGIPKLFHSVAAGSSIQPARSPPGGDAIAEQ